jgi:hypothetical protein
MARILNSPGKSAHSALKLIRKLSFQKRVAPLAKQSESASHVMCVKSVLNTLWHMMNALVSGAVSQSVSVVDLSVALRKGNQQQFPALGLTLGRFFP